MARTLAVGLVGAWLGLLVASWIVASANFRTVDRVLGPDLRRELDQTLAGVAPDARRVALRHLASEVNRFIFRAWGPLQLVLGAAALGLVWRTGGAPRVLLAAALALLAAQTLALSGPIVELGRTLDFTPRPLPADVGRRFGLLHAAYVGGDFVKAAVLLAAAWLAARRAVP